MPWMLKVNEYGACKKRRERKHWRGIHFNCSFAHCSFAHCSSGMTPLHKVASNGYVDAAAVLLRHGARINITTRSGNTALHVASRHGHTNMVHVSSSVC